MTTYFIYARISPKHRWTIHGSYENDETAAERQKASLFADGWQVRMEVLDATR